MEVRCRWRQESFHGLYERQNRKNSFYHPVMSRSGLTGSVQRPHQERQITSRRLQQELLVHVLETPDIKPVQTTRVKLMREVSLDPFPPLPRQVPATIALYAPTVGCNGPQKLDKKKAFS